MTSGRRRRHASVVSAEELEQEEDKGKGKGRVQDIASPGGGYRARRWRLGAAAGSSSLGCSLYEVPAAAAAFPAHYHAANEEALYVLDGEGILLIGDQDEVRVKAGDYVALPAGPKHAHKLMNRGPDPLRYLAVSTMNNTDVVVYPDSGKVGVLAGAAPGDNAAAAGGGKRYVAGFVRMDELNKDYYAGEE